MRGFFNSRRFRQGTMATAITVVVVAIVVVVNFASTALTDRFGLTLDLTPTKIMSITDETKGYIADLPKDVLIYVLANEQEFAASSLQANEILKRFDLESDRIQIVYKDILADPAFTQNYPTLQLSVGSILVTSGDKVRDLRPNDLYETQMDEYTYETYPVASQAEQTLTSAILAVTSDIATNVAVISGHEEEDVAEFRSLLQANNYLVDQVSILTDDIDPSYAVAVIPGPVRDFTEEELQRLDRFLENGGAYGKTLLYFASSQTAEMPNLDAFLQDWGIVVEPGMVYETNPQLRVPSIPALALLEYADADRTYSADVVDAGLLIESGFARPVRLAFESDSYLTTSTLLQFSATAGVPGEEATTIEEVEPSGPIPHLVMSQYLNYDGTDPIISQVLVAGATTLIMPEFLMNASLGNSEYMLSLLDNLTGKEEGVHIQSKPLTSETLNMNAAQASAITVVLVVAFPLALLVFGLVIWARRRHR